MFSPSDVWGDGLRPVPPTGSSGVFVVSAVMSLIGRPDWSKPHESERSSSSFCCASTAAYVVLREPMLLLVDIANSCASDTSAEASSAVATSTSSSEKPAALLDELDFAKAVHRNYFDCRPPRDRDGSPVEVDLFPGKLARQLLVNRAVGPELEGGGRA